MSKTKYKQITDDQGRTYNLVSHKGVFIKMETMESAIARNIQIEYPAMGTSGKPGNWKKQGKRVNENPLPERNERLNMDAA